MNIPRAMVGEPTSPTPAKDDLSLTISALALRMGVAPGTLRTWDRCYGVSPTDHSSGSDRRYTTQDVLRVGLMRHFLSHGTEPAEAARLAQAVSTDTVVPVGDTTLTAPGAAAGTISLRVA